MAKAGRPRLLTPDTAPHLIERLVLAVERGATLEEASREAGVTSRSLRRWRAIGQRELDGLSAEARLVLALDRAQPPTEPIDWKAEAAFLEAQFPERWLDDLIEA